MNATSTVLITGGAGFIGSHLAEALLQRGHRVVAVDDLSTGSLDNIRPLLGRPDFQFVRESVRNATTMTPLVDRCDLIYHLAAAVGVQLIVDEPVHTIETNIHGSEVVLNLANKFRRKIFVASTSEVYGKSTKVPFNEDDDTTLGSTTFTRWSYACSKMIDEFLALAYHGQYGLETIVCRFFNTIGPRQTGQYGMVVPRFVRQALRNEPLEIYGSGQQSRCFSNVADGVEALRIWEENQDSIHLLFTDLVMPKGVRGHELAARLQARSPKLRVVFTSGYSADIAGRQLSLQEGQNFIQKPSSYQQLLETVRRCLDS